MISVITRSPAARLAEHAADPVPDEECPHAETATQTMHTGTRRPIMTASNTVGGDRNASAEIGVARKIGSANDRGVPAAHNQSGTIVADGKRLETVWIGPTPDAAPTL